MPIEPVSAPPASAPRVLVARGARAAEELLLDRVEEALADGGIAALARPVRVVVPSGSLRLHVAAELARRAGRARLGVVVQTLYALALEVLDRGGVAPRVAGAGGDLTFEVLVRRAARRQRALASRLEHLVDGYGAAAATVRDLLDAGFEAAHAAAADEALAAAREQGVPGDEIERARALVVAAVEVERDLSALGAARRSSLLRRAGDLLAEDPEVVLPSRAVFVHGFADATGVATDLLEALVRRRAATVIVDTPPDPVPAAWAGGDGAAVAEDAVEAAVEAAHGERLRERLGGAGGLGPAPLPPTPPPELTRFSADGTETEAREVALRVRELLDRGARPEGIAIVARDLAPHRLALRRQLTLLGVPFSGLAATGALDAAGRRAQALLDLLRRRQDLPGDRWLDAADSLVRPRGGRRPGPFVDLRLAFSSLGAGRLGDVAGLDLDRVLGGRDWMPLPILRGLAAGRRDEDDETEDEEEREGGQPARRTVSRSELAVAVAAAARLVDRLASWPPRAAAGEHLRRLGTMLTQELGWRSAGGPADAGGREPVFTALERLAADLPPALELDGEELRLILGRALEETGRGPLGGRGGGVQVLGVVEARGRTFEHLFVVGANRNAFPRPVRQDPLLGDDLRAALAPVLPDLTRKQAGFDEERHLFAELLSASPRVTVSWWSRNDDGRAVAPSPLVERLAPGEEATVAATLHALGRDRGPLPAAESATLAALHGGRRERFGQLLGSAIAENAGDERDEREEPGAAACPVADPRILAAARVAVLDEIDPDLRTPEGRAAAAALGPYFGFIGRRGGLGDLRGSGLWVTHAESLAACPWQLFLERLLKLEPTPDPLQALPGTDPLLLGSVVHAVLEELAVAAGVPAGQPIAETLAADDPLWVEWPRPEELEGRVLAVARRVLIDEGVPLPGLARALAAQAIPYLERARELDWKAGDLLAVLAVEALGTVTIEEPDGRRRRLDFRADRVDRTGAPGDPATVRLTDYKTGKPPSTAKSEDKRREHHLRRVAEGRNLQATAYQLALAAGAEGGGRVVGRYLYLRPDVEPVKSEVAVADDAAFTDHFTRTVRAVFASWDTGGFFPRVVDTAGEKTPIRCSYCRVAEACLLGDSGARRRLHAWASAGDRAEGAAEAAALGVWRLHDPAALSADGDPEEAG